MINEKALVRTGRQATFGHLRTALAAKDGVEIWDGNGDDFVTDLNAGKILPGVIESDKLTGTNFISSQTLPTYNYTYDVSINAPVNLTTESIEAIAKAIVKEQTKLHRQVLRK